VRRTVDPLGLVLKAGAWYLVARAAESIRTYKIAKVLEACILTDRFTYPAGFDLASHWRHELNRFERSLRRGAATLRVSSAALSRLDRLGADMAEPVLAAPADHAGWRRAVVPIESVDHAAGLLLSFADEIEVVAPPALRAALARRAGRVLALYGDDADET
jgi:predicted DNA-binding transcriptional regulator YafY